MKKSRARRKADRERTRRSFEFATRRLIRKLLPVAMEYVRADLSREYKDGLFPELRFDR